MDVLELFSIPRKPPPPPPTQQLEDVHEDVHAPFVF